MVLLLSDCFHGPEDFQGGCKVCVGRSFVSVVGFYSHRLDAVFKLELFFSLLGLRYKLHLCSDVQLVFVDRFIFNN